MLGSKSESPIALAQPPSCISAHAHEQFAARTEYEIPLFGITQKSGNADVLSHSVQSCVRRAEQLAYVPQVSLMHASAQEVFAVVFAQAIEQLQKGVEERKGEEQEEELYAQFANAPAKSLGLLLDDLKKRKVRKRVNKMKKRKRRGKRGKGRKGTLCHCKQHRMSCLKMTLG